MTINYKLCFFVLNVILHKVCCFNDRKWYIWNHAYCIDYYKSPFGSDDRLQITIKQNHNVLLLSMA